MGGMNWCELEQEQLEKAAKTSIEYGLTEKDAEKRLRTYGANKLDEGEKTPALYVFLAQFKDFMVLVLLVATLISGFLGEYLDAITIMLIVLLNGILGFIQERKAEKSLAALKELSSPQMTVLRGGIWEKVPSLQIVPGDVVKIMSGDRIGADLRLVQTNGLHIEESSLTGESVPVHKKGEVLEKKAGRARRTGEYGIYGYDGHARKWPWCRCSNRDENRNGQNRSSTSVDANVGDTFTEKARAIREAANCCSHYAYGLRCSYRCFSRT